jgi:hypothetical protein
MAKSKKYVPKHRKALEKIALNPSLFEIKGKVVGICIEKKLYDTKNRITSMIAEPDIIFNMSNKKIVIVEYKSNGNHKEYAQEQLNKAFYWFGKYTSIPSEKISGIIIEGNKYPLLKKL